MADEVVDFKDRINKFVVIELNGKRYRLNRYTIAKEIKLKEMFGGNLDGWEKNLDVMDPETLVKTLWFLLEDHEYFVSWEFMAEQLSGDLTEKMNMSEAILSCMLAGMPDAQQAVKKRADYVKKKVLTLLQSSLTGPGSTTTSQKPTAGHAKKSKNSRTTK